MQDNETSRLTRLTAILVLLQSKRLVTANQVAEKFAISKRTAYRDIKALEDAGVPILVEEGKGYSLMDGYHLPPVMFSEQEANALITAEQLVATNKDASFVKNYHEAITKIKAVLKYNVRDRSNLLADRIHFRINASQEITSNHLSCIQLAITHFNVISVTYISEDNQSSVRMIEPLGLYSTQENWILIAHCRLRDDKRAFRLDRITKLDVLAENFEQTDFTLQRYFEEYRLKYFPGPLP